MKAKSARSKSSVVVDLADEAARAARAAALRYVTDSTPGITRRRTGTGFSFRTPAGRPVRSAAEIARIRSLAIPPAWTSVWICPIANGHLQATGRDARGRKQYRYHTRWRQVRDETKYAKLTTFAHAIPRIRKRVSEHLALPGHPREKVLAIIVRLLESTFIRVGNDEYARDNGSFGLTTMQNRHMRAAGNKVQLAFRGKSGKAHAVDITDAGLARLVKRCRDLPGQQLFQYLDDDGRPQPVDSADVNAYLREIAGDDFTAKDFRTWAGGLLALRLIPGELHEGRGSKAKMLRAIEAVAKDLGNTPTICRKCYIHPDVLAAFQDAETFKRLAYARAHPIRERGLRAEERVFARFLTLGERKTRARAA
jgi:DNA topoisomerase-1